MASQEKLHPFKRSIRVSDLIRQEVSEAILYKLKDPRLGFITVTEVDMPDDLKLARVYISVFDQNSRELTLEILNKASSFIRREVGRNLRLRSIPKIEFFYDEAIDYGMKIDNLLAQQITKPQSGFQIEAAEKPTKDNKIKGYEDETTD